MPCISVRLLIGLLTAVFAAGCGGEDLAPGSVCAANACATPTPLPTHTPTPAPLGGTRCDGAPDGTTCDQGLDVRPPLTCESGTCRTCSAQTTGAHFVDNGDGTITDRQTCMVWEKKDHAGGVHDQDNGYTWSTCADYPTCSPDGTAFTKFLAGLNSTAFAGHQDWRLPKEEGQDGRGPNELESILALPCTSSPCVDPVFNRNCTTACSATGATPCSCTRSSGYWSATTVAGNPTTAWTAYFFSGTVTYNLKYNNVYVRAVRGGLCVADPAACGLLR